MSGNRKPVGAGFKPAPTKPRYLPSGVRGRPDLLIDLPISKPRKRKRIRKRKHADL
jgi:hypothetical protein